MKIENLKQGNNIYLAGRKNLFKKNNNNVSFGVKITSIDRPKDLVTNLKLYSEKAEYKKMGIINYNCYVGLLQKGVRYVRSLFHKENAIKDIDAMYESSYNVLNSYLNSQNNVESNNKDYKLIKNCVEIYALKLDTFNEDGSKFDTKDYACKLYKAILTNISRGRFDDEDKCNIIKEKYKKIKKYLDVAYDKLFSKKQVLEQGNVSIDFRRNELVIDGLKNDKSMYYTIGDSVGDAYIGDASYEEAYYFMKSYKFVSETLNLLNDYFKCENENQKENLALRLQSIPNDAKRNLPVISKEKLIFDENDITYERIKSSFLDKSSDEVGRRNSSIKEEDENFVFYSAHKDEPEANVKVDKRAQAALDIYFRTISKLCGQKNYATLLHLAHRFLQRNPIYEGTKIIYGAKELNDLKDYVETIKNDIDILLNKKISRLSKKGPISYYNPKNKNSYIIALNPSDRGKYQNKTYTIFIYNNTNKNKESLLNCNLVINSNGNYGLLTFIESDNKLKGDYDFLSKEVEKLKKLIKNKKNAINKLENIKKSISEKKVQSIEQLNLDIKNRESEIRKINFQLEKKNAEKDGYIFPWKRYRIKPKIVI